MGSSPVCAAGDVTAEDQLALIWTKHTAAAAGKAKTNTCSTLGFCQQSPANTRPAYPVASCEPSRDVGRHGTELCHGVGDVRLQPEDAAQAQGADAQGAVLRRRDYCSGARNQKWFFSKIILNVQGRHILCHKVVLASASEYFENMFRWLDSSYLILSSSIYAIERHIFKVE